LPILTRGKKHKGTQAQRHTGEVSPSTTGKKIHRREEDVTGKAAGHTAKEWWGRG